MKGHSVLVTVNSTNDRHALQKACEAIARLPVAIEFSELSLPLTAD